MNYYIGAVIINVTFFFIAQRKEKYICNTSAAETTGWPLPPELNLRSNKRKKCYTFELWLWRFNTFCAYVVIFSPAEYCHLCLCLQLYHFFFKKLCINVHYTDAFSKGSCWRGAFVTEISSHVSEAGGWPAKGQNCPFWDIPKCR